MKFIASIIYIFAISTIFVNKAFSGNPSFFFSYFDIVFSGMLPIVHFALIKRFYDYFSADMSYRQRHYIYALPIFYPLLFNFLFLETGDGSIGTMIANYSIDELKFLLIVFVMNFTLIMISLIPQKKENVTETLAEPTFENDNSLNTMPVEIESKRKAKLIYALTLLLFFSVLLLPIIFRS